MVVNLLADKKVGRLVHRHLRTMFAVLNKWLFAFKLVWQANPLAAIITSVLTVVVGPLSAIYLYCWKKVIDGVALWLQGKAADGRSMVVFFLGLTCIVLLVQFALERLIRVMEQMLRLRLTYCTQKQILDHAASLDMTFFETPSFYDKLNRAQREVGSRPYTIISSFFNIARQCFTLCSFMIILFTLSPWAPCYLLLATIPSLIVQIKFGQFWWSVLFRRTPEQRRMDYYQYLLTSPPEAKEIRIFGLADYLITQWQNVFQLFYDQESRFNIRRNLTEFGVLSTQTIAVIAFYIFIIYKTISTPAFGIGSLIMYTQTVERSVNSLSALLGAIGSLYENGLYMNNLFDYLALKPVVCVPQSPTVLPEIIRRGISLESVSFRYPGGDTDVLHDISFEIRAGEKVAIVGENGAGKTTLVKLLSRLYDPQKGRITVDGIDLRQVDPSGWYQKIAVIFQDFAHYWVTARENIGFGQLDFIKDMERIRHAATFSGITECIEKLNNGWETILGKVFDEGQDLSIGEWQKIALARAFLREAQILVLDEPTASLDPKIEYKIFAKFNEITEGKTTILISHRFSTVRMVDRIFVIERGRLIEYGTHDELMANGNRYAELFNRQASAYR